MNEAWDFLQDHYQNTINQAFCKVGTGLHLDCCEDIKVQVKRLDSIIIGHYSREYYVDEPSTLTQESDVAAEANIESKSKVSDPKPDAPARKLKTRRARTQNCQYFERQPLTTSYRRFLMTEGQEENVN